MATEASVTEDLQPVKRSRSLPYLPPDMSELRVVLLGNSWSERSSVGNFILGENVFNTEEEPDCCQRVRGQWKEKQIVLINTPDLLHYNISDDRLRKYVKNYVRLSDPHVILLVLQIGNITPEEKDSVELIKKYFGQRSGDFTIIIFTRGEELDDQSFESYIKGCDDFVKQLINDCGGRYQLFNNKDETNRTQVRELLTKIETMVKENGDSCYTADMFDDTEESTKIQVERIMKEKEEEMKETKRKHEEELQTLKRKINEQRGEIEQERKLRSKQLKDKDESINKEREERKKEREEDKKRWKKQEETLRQEWRGRLEASDKRVQLEREQKETAERKLEQSRKEMKRDREAWDKEKRDMWERMHQDLKQNLEEEKTSFKKLQEEYYHKRKKWTYSFFVLWTVFLTLVLCYVLLR